MLFLTSDEPSRWQRARSTVGDAARSAAGDKRRAMRVLIVPVAVAMVVLCVRAVRTRSAAGEEASEDTSAGAPAAASGESPSRDEHARRDLQPSGNRAGS